MMTKDQALAPLAACRRDEVVVTTMGMVRPWARHSTHPLDFASADSAMGHAADLAVGIALARPERKVVCLNGDGSMLMTLGTLVTAVENGATNLVLFVIQNDTYEITGNQPIPGARRVDFPAMARAAGFAHAFRFDDATAYAGELPRILQLPGPVLVCLAVEPGQETPLGRQGKETAAYLQLSAPDEARRFRSAVTGGG
jgi:thiamine pyrophosphate-dependent acetolactate synthase large subunit-like protein